MNMPGLNAEASLYTAGAAYPMAGSPQAPAADTEIVPQQVQPDPACVGNCESQRATCVSSCDSQRGQCLQGCRRCESFHGGCTGAFWSFTRQCVTSPRSGFQQCCGGWYQYPWIQECSDGSRSSGCGACFV
jgi:hypothetical protein